MLVEFRVKNFLSFKDEAIFSMLTSGDKEHPENLIPFDEKNNEYLLKSALIYGANASGKTNLLKAFHFVFYTVLASKDFSTSDNINIFPFLFDEKTSHKPSFFEVRFIKNNSFYIYGIKLDSEKIYHEYLYKSPEGKFSSKPKKIFERTEKEEFNINANLSKLKKRYLIESAHNRSYLSIAGFREDPEVVNAYKWFEDSVKCFIPGTFVRETPEGYTKKRIIKENKPNEPYIEKISEIFKKIDSGITGIAITKIDMEKVNIPGDIPEDKRKEILKKIKENSIMIMSMHEVNDTVYTLPFDFASLGTQKMLDLIGILLDLIEKNGVLIMDELENSLHPELTKELLKQIQKSGCNVQMIFTTHDTALMDLDIFRRDQFWFTAKDRKKQYSELFSLGDIQGIRSKENIQKKYLSGRYGAVPYIQEFEKALCK